MVHSLDKVKYIVTPNHPNISFYNECKTNLNNWKCADICSSFLHSLKNNQIQECINELESLLSKYENDKNIIKLWHIFYDYLTCKHKSMIFDTPKQIVETLTKSLSSFIDLDTKNVIITMTTCKRMDLTYRTINSMLYCITDLEKYVGKFLVVDDNSSEEDRTKLLQCYPFITLIRKDATQKGHPKSMNIILNEIKNYKYQFHVEDDWEFFYPSNYIEKCITVLESNQKYGQCLVNRDYGEDQITINNIGGSEYKKINYNLNISNESKSKNKNKNNNSLKYYEHRHFKGLELEKESTKCGLANNLYWPHFSFRVGLTKTEIYPRIGLFNEEAKHFEMEYAERYTENGYITTFLDKVYCTHIGRRTYERNDNTKKNAYDLNEEIQFGQIKSNDENNSDVNSGVNNGVNNKQIRINIYVVNLQRRKDRLLNFFKHNSNELYTFNVYDAVDGSKIIPNSKVQRLFQNGDYNYRRGIVGVACSMIDIWKKFLSDTLCDYAIIFEDDVKVTPNFMPKVIRMIEENKDQFDIIYGHMNPYPRTNKEDYYKTEYIPKLIKISTAQMMQENMGSLATTILTKEGARILLEDINKKGVYNAIDWVAMKTCDLQRAFVTIPFIAFADAYQTNNKKDTDIQTDYNTCGLKNWVQYEIDYWKNQLKTKKNTTIRIVCLNSSSNKLISTIKSTCDNIEIKNLSSINELKPNDILICDQTEISSAITNICIYPLETKISCKTLYYYYTDKCIFVVPISFLNDTNITEKVWGEGYLNMNYPI